MGPDYSLETNAMAEGFANIIGVDEVGRGSLAGPVTAAAVWLNPDDIPQGLNDSKKLSLKRREAVFDQIITRAKVSVAHATVAEIDKINILQAAHLAMARAVTGLSIKADLVLVDGNKVPGQMSTPARAIIRGDGKSVSISAASIVAKICRDRIMCDLAQQYPGYGWEKNAAYPSKSHISALSQLGVTPHHRRSFRPVHNML